MSALISFESLGVPSHLVGLMASQGIVEPSAVQTSAIPVVLGGHSARIHAETGTGKTLAYLLPVLMRLDMARAATQVVILAPTHELALQIHRVACGLSPALTPAPRVVLLMGETAISRQIEKLKKKPQVVVGTPGRVAELIALKKLKTNEVRVLVFDEADRMICPEASHPLSLLLKAIPTAAQKLFVSATETNFLSQMVKEWVPDAHVVQAARHAINPDITHYLLPCEARDKPDWVRKIIRAINPSRALVFVHEGRRADEITARLEHHGLSVAALVGTGDKNSRKFAMDGIRSGTLQVIIASDIAARGLDIPQVDLIINVDPPSQSAAYVHRVGRTARAGRKGVAITLLEASEMRLARRYQEDLCIEITPITIRDGQVAPAI